MEHSEATQADGGGEGAAGERGPVRIAALITVLVSCAAIACMIVMQVGPQRPRGDCVPTDVLREALPPVGGAALVIHRLLSTAVALCVVYGVAGACAVLILRDRRSRLGGLVVTCAVALAGVALLHLSTELILSGFRREISAAAHAYQLAKLPERASVSYEGFETGGMAIAKYFVTYIPVVAVMVLSVACAHVSRRAES